ncbi:MAG: 50S ribosomal protein L25 [Acidobacteria bacterium]|nr:MAG: 50S ribosomal protein L25 [Acidobacteriota bacterium]
MKEYIEVEPRELTGKGPNRRLRKLGMIPGVVYGGDRKALSISISEKEVWQMLHAETGLNTVRMLKLAGTDRKRTVMIKDYQSDPITRRVIHADFLRVNPDQEIEVTVPVKIIGTSYGVKTEGGMMDFIARDLDLIAKVTEIPAAIEVDVSELRIGDSLRVKDLSVENVTFTVPEETVIVKVDVMRISEEPTEEAEELLEEGEEAAEAAAETEAETATEQK